MRLFEVEGTGVNRDIDVIFQVLDSVVPDGEGSYLAAPISTGKRFFQALAEYEVKDFPSLVEKIGHDEYLRLVRWPNVEEGEALALRLRNRGISHLINTGPIFIKEWQPRDYMNLCLRLIGRKVKSVYFHPEWAYSSGAVEELIFCAQRRLALFTSEGLSLSLEDARNALDSVRSYLQSLGCPTELVERQIMEVEKLVELQSEEVDSAATRGVSVIAQ
jgi:hypothetical protein